MESAAEVRAAGSTDMTSSLSDPNHLPVTEAQQLDAITMAAAIGKRPAAAALGIDRKTLQRWIDKHPQHWSDAIAGKVDERRKQFAAALEELSEHYADAERLAIEEAVKQLESGDLDAKEVAALIKAMGASRGVAAVSASRARGEPDNTTQVNVNFPALEKRMEQLLEQGAKRVPNLEESTGNGR